MTRARWSLAVAGMVAAIVAAVPSVRAAVTDLALRDETRFPHAKHAGLFPSCVGCHGGVLGGDSVAAPLMGTRGTSLYPEPSQCAGCHDGTVQPRVAWDGPRREGSNLRFSHAEHNREADLGEPALNCGECHQQGGATGFMAVARARPEPCVACHGHQAPSHLADASPCRTCHVPVARAVALTAAQVRGFSRPASHDDPDVISDHAPDLPAAQARCAVCHARESCERCHVNAAAVPQIAALERDPRIAQVVATIPPSYPVPASHREADWAYAHGGEARSAIVRCANCHTQPGCLACHTGPLGARTIARLPAGSPTGRGVQLRHDPEATTLPPLGGPHATTSDGDVVLQGGTLRSRRMAVSGLDTTPRDTTSRDTTRRVAVRPDTAKRVRVHPPGFARTHGPAAAAEQLSCAGCHETKRFCTDCHDGESKRRYHPANFVARHPTDAYARQTACASCHSREGFCGACHQRVGLQSQGRLGVAYHTAQPLWLIQHGRAARQGLESCTTCHVQRDCLQCHAVTGWGVNPHGPRFDARRMADRNAQTCRACHVGDPFAGRP